MKKRLLSLLLALVMVIGMIPMTSMTAFATSYTGTGTEEDPYIVTTFEDLKTLYEDGSTSAYIKLGADIYGSEQLGCLGEEGVLKTIDLAGQKLHIVGAYQGSQNHSAIGMYFKGSLTIMDSVGEGSIVADQFDGAISTTTSGTLRICGGNIHATGGNNIYGTLRICAEFYISGGTFSSYPGTADPASNDVVTVWGNRTGVISGGTFKGIVNICDDSKVKITGGKFEHTLELRVTDKTGECNAEVDIYGGCFSAKITDTDGVDGVFNPIMTTYGNGKVVIHGIEFDTYRAYDLFAELIPVLKTYENSTITVDKNSFTEDGVSIANYEDYVAFINENMNNGHNKNVKLKIICPVMLSGAELTTNFSGGDVQSETITLDTDANTRVTISECNSATFKVLYDASQLPSGWSVDAATMIYCRGDDSYVSDTQKNIDTTAAGFVETEYEGGFIAEYEYTAYTAFYIYDENRELMSVVSTPTYTIQPRGTASGMELSITPELALGGRYLEAGKKLSDYSFVLEENASSAEVENGIFVTWYKNGTEWVDDSHVIENETQYTALIRLPAAENYRFTEDSYIRCNGRIAHIESVLDNGLWGDFKVHFASDCDHVEDTTKWNSDGTGHWRTCSDCGDKLDVMEHTFETTYEGLTTKKTCKECGYYKEIYGERDAARWFFIWEEPFAVGDVIPSTLGVDTTDKTGDYITSMELKWYKDGSPISAGGYFEAGHTYTVNVTMYADADRYYVDAAYPSTIEWHERFENSHIYKETDNATVVDVDANSVSRTFPVEVWPNITADVELPIIKSGDDVEQTVLDLVESIKTNPETAKSGLQIYVIGENSSKTSHMLYYNNDKIVYAPAEDSADKVFHDAYNYKIQIILQHEGCILPFDMLNVVNAEYADKIEYPENVGRTRIIAYYNLQAAPTSHSVTLDSASTNVTYDGPTSIMSNETLTFTLTAADGYYLNRPDIKVGSSYLSASQYTYNEATGKVTVNVPVKGDVVIYATAYEQGKGVTVAGSVTSFGDASDITIQLIAEGSSSEPAYEVTAKAGEQSGTKYQGVWSVGNVLPGTYTVKVMKKNHVTREYTVTVSENTTLNVEIWLKGDVTGDGRVNAGDHSRVYVHISKTKLLEGYALLCADVTGDGKVNAGDHSRLYAHISKTKPLF